MQQHDPVHGLIDLDVPAKNRGNPSWVRGMTGFTPPSTRPPRPENASFEIAVARARAQGKQCMVMGCHRPTEDFGRFCYHHRNRHRRHGHPTAGHLPRRLLGPLAADAIAYLAQIDRLPEDSPARAQLALARHWIRVKFAQSNGYEGLGWRPHQAHEVRLKRHLANLDRHGVTADNVLALIIAFYGVRELYPAMLEDEAHQRFQLSRLVLQTVSLPPTFNGRPESHGVRYMTWLGNLLMDNLGTAAAWIGYVLVTGEGQAGFPTPAFKTPSAAAVQKAIGRTQYRPLDGEDAYQH